MAKKKTEPERIQDMTPPVQDIDHEVIPFQTNGQSLPAVLPLQERIRLEVAKFGLADQGIAELKDKYGALTIAGPEDTQGYKTVKAAWADVRSKRTFFEKKGLALRSDYTAINKAIGKEEDRLVDLITPLEKELEAKWKKIDEDKEAEKRKAEKDAADRLLARVTELVQLGAVPVEGGYQLGDTVSVDVATLGAWSEQSWQLFLQAAKKKAEEIRLAKEAQEAERKAKEEATRKQEEELVAAQQRLAEEQAELAQHRQEIAAQIRVVRAGQLAGIGMVDAGDRYLYRDEFNKLEIIKGLALEMNSEQWAEYLKSATAAVSQYKLEREKKLEEEVQERKRIAERKDKIWEAMARGGLAYNFTDNVFTFQNSISTVIIGMDSLLADFDRLEQLEADLTKQVADLKAAELQKQAEEARQKEEQRQAAMDDAELWEIYLCDLRKKAPWPTKALTTEKYKQRYESFYTRLNNLLNEFSDE